MFEFTSFENIERAWHKVRNWGLYKSDDSWAKRRKKDVDAYMKIDILEFQLNEQRRL